MNIKFITIEMLNGIILGSCITMFMFFLNSIFTSYYREKEKKRKEVFDIKIQVSQLHHEINKINNRIDKIQQYAKHK